MRIIKLNEVYRDIDPHGEEDWDERDMFLFSIILWIGRHTGNCELKSNHVTKRLEGKYITISINGLDVQRTTLEKYQSIMSDESFCGINNKIIIFDIDKISDEIIENITNRMVEFINYRISTSKESVKRSQYIIDNDGYDDEEDEEYDLGEAEETLEREENIVKNLKILKDTIRDDIKKKINNIIKH